MENYNGYKNWQTYLVDLHSEQNGYYNSVRDFLREEPKEVEITVESIANMMKTDWLDKYDETDTEIDLFNTFISWSLAEVDWMKLAQDLKESV